MGMITGKITIDEIDMRDELDTRTPADVAAVTRAKVGALVEAYCAKVRVAKTYRVEWHDFEGVRVESGYVTVRATARRFAEGVKAARQRDVRLITVEEV